MNITGSKVTIGIGSQSGGILQVVVAVVCLGSIGIAGKHALRLPSVETAGCIAHSREDVVLSVYTGGVAMDILLVVAVHIL